MIITVRYRKDGNIMITKSGFILMNKQEFIKYIMELKVSRKITTIHNHHTWKPDYSNCNSTNHIQVMQNMKNYHMNVAGYSDIAQNFSTYKDGAICVGRNLNIDPASISGQNTGAICIENIGNFDIGQDNMTQAHKDTIVFLNAVLCLKFNLQVNDSTILYHSWFAKTCPGSNFFNGNTRNHAKTYFYPLIITEMNRLKSEINPVIIIIIYILITIAITIAIIPITHIATV